MRQWTVQQLSNLIDKFVTLSPSVQQNVTSLMNRAYPPEIFEQHRNRRRNALSHMNDTRRIIGSATQAFPPFVSASDLEADNNALRGFSIVFTAGGEGERLKTSLLKQGVAPQALVDFTKATFGLPGFPGDFGTLQINLAMVSSICRDCDIDIPVIITTGPAGSTTDRVISGILERHDNFGLRHVRVIAQDERLFLTNDERIVLHEVNGELRPITHPDETGGPLMKLKQPSTAPDGASVLEWCESSGSDRTIVVQATALYDRTLLPLMAAALKDHDCLGVGILRDSFVPSDPYGTFVTVKTDERNVTMILEQDVRNEQTLSLTSPDGKHHLPFNTGFYALRNSLLAKNDLPDFATPPKELRPDLARAPKIGYAAIDLITLARNPVILAIDQTLFGVLKNAGDLDVLSQLGRRFGLDSLYTQFTG